jgi:CDGSH-type Zn-finger protein
MITIRVSTGRHELDLSVWRRLDANSKKKNEVANTSSEERIKVSRNGPYHVSGAIPVYKTTIIADDQGTANEWREGGKYPVQETYDLCRCGQSRSKPFCDETHKRIGFDGTEKASRSLSLERAKEIEGPTVKLLDAEELCASARFCHRAGGTWDLVPRSDDPEVKRIAIEEARDCPSGRLMILDKKTNEIVEPEYERSIGVIEDPQVGVSGPLWVRGGIPVISADGRQYEIRNRVTLCRCGKSLNKPFCDSAHYPE